ncbi:MAG: hypothetical protein N2Z22_02735 [Turneriella sp.]|nr:hypothetical protein [Turneriella sp.]
MLLFAAAAWLLYPCAKAKDFGQVRDTAKPEQTHPTKKIPPNTEGKAPRTGQAALLPKSLPQHAEPKLQKAEEKDDSPPVDLRGSQSIPDVAQCVHAKFPPEARDYVQSATVNVELVVDRTGRVRSVRTIAVELPKETPEEHIPMLRKSFIKAGNTAFGKKICPQHLLSGKPVAYTIEVPLQFKH